MRMTVGGWEANLKRAVSRPRSSMSSSRTILMTCSDGERAVSTSVADGLGADVLDELLDDIEVDVGFEHGDADFFQRLIHVFFGKRALAS